jgi:hypothetical protein
MAATITLRFAATCRDCGAALAPGDRARFYGRGRVYGTACHANSGENAARATGAAAFFARRKSGPCEDAPCCGCCGPQGDGSGYGGNYYGDR